MAEDVSNDVENSLLHAARNLDWNALREASLQPDGFGELRKEIWPLLLFVPQASEELEEVPPPVLPNAPNPSATETFAHRDERQIKLDTDRSFVMYPVGDPRDREELQTRLNELLVSVFRKRPLLNYFQGYHDIITVIFLTLPQSCQFAAATKLNLHRIRDSMGPGLEPLVGLLRILQNLLRLADPSFATILDQNTSLPYFSLSNLLTLFAHDVPTLPLIQHVFDFLFSRSPIAVVYLAAAVTLARKEEARLLVERGEEGMLHSLLTGLPRLTGEDESQPQPVKMESVEASHPDEAFAVKDEEGSETSVKRFDEDMDVKQGSIVPDAASGQSERARVNDSSGLPDTQADAPSSSTPADVLSSSQLDPLAKEEEDDHVASSSRPGTPSSTSSLHPPPRSIPLLSLLKQADELYSHYPPSHPSLALSTIIGPNSVIFTWNEDPSQLPADDDAEKMVTEPGKVVYPYIPELPPDSDEEGDEEEHWDEKPGRSKRPRRKLRKPPPKRRAARRVSIGPIEVKRRTVVAGAVLVLSIAIAVYGMQGSLTAPGGRGGGHHAFGHVWKKVGRWAGGALLGVERTLQPFPL